jgi:MFS family permease
MPFIKPTFAKVAASFTPFWFFLLLFKFSAGGIHYTLIAVLGERVLPLPIVGLCIGLSAALQTILDIPAGFMLERYGYLRMLRFSTLCFILAGAVLILGLTPATFILSTFFGAFGWLFFTPGVSAYLLAHCPVQIIGKIMGVHRAMQAIGLTIAVLCLPLFVQFSGTVIGLLVLYPLIGALAALIIAERKQMPTMLPERTRHRRHLANASFATLVKTIKELQPLSTAFGLYSFVTAAFYGLLWFTLPLIIASNTSTHIISLGMAVFDGTTIFVGFLIGRLVDTRNKKMLAYLALALIAFSAFFLWSTFQPLFIVLCFILSTGDEMFTITLWSWIDKQAPRGENYGLISGALTFAEDCGWMIGPIVAGLLYAFIGPINTLRFSGLTVALIIIIIAFLLRKAHISTIGNKIDEKS